MMTSINFHAHDHETVTLAGYLANGVGVNGTGSRSVRGHYLLGFRTERCGPSNHRIEQQSASGFSVSSSYENVEIEVSLISFGGGDWNLSAWLTDQARPGTTQRDNEIGSLTSTITLASSTLFAPYTITPLTLFFGTNTRTG